MTTLRFIPIFEDELFIKACSEYQSIWNSDGPSIVQAYKEITGLTLEEDRIAVLVYEGVSFSGRNQSDAMKLRASYEYDVKKGTLIHELGHRLTFAIQNDSSEEEHRFLNLFLYDVWQSIYGKDFADMMVAVESRRTDMYKRAWEYALAMDFNERQKILYETLSPEKRKKVYK